MANRIVLNETSYFGWGSREVLVEEIKKRKYKKALLVTEKNLVKVGVTNKVTELLDNNGIDYEVFDGVIPNPTIGIVKKGLKIANKYHVDYIIAIGGGSVIDTAKAIGVFYNNPELKDINKLVGYAETNKSLPIIALPTTSGSGSEASISYEIVDEEKKVKLVCFDTSVIPVLSIIDAELIAGMPASTMAATGIDALAHAIEAYIAKGQNEMSDMYALKAMNIIYYYLEKAVNKDRDAIEKIAFAQYIAGLSFSNAGLGIVNSMAHQLVATYNVPQCVANSLLLPYGLEFNADACLDRYIYMAVAFGLDIKDLGKKEVAEKFINSIKELSSRLNITQSLKEFGVKESDVSELAKKAMDDPCINDNPKEVDILDLEELFKKAF